MAEQMDVLDLQQGADYLGLSTTKLGELAGIEPTYTDLQSAPCLCIQRVAVSTAH